MTTPRKKRWHIERSSCLRMLLPGPLSDIRRATRVRSGCGTTSRRGRTSTAAGTLRSSRRSWSSASATRFQGRHCRMPFWVALEGDGGVRRSPAVILIDLAGGAVQLGKWSRALLSADLSAICHVCRTSSCWSDNHFVGGSCAIVGLPLLANSKSSASPMSARNVTPSSAPITFNCRETSGLKYAPICTRRDPASCVCRVFGALGRDLSAAVNLFSSSLLMCHLPFSTGREENV